MKLPYVAKCDIEPEDTLEVSVDSMDGMVSLVMESALHGDVVTLYLPAEKARKLARAIKKAAKEVDAL